MDNRSHLLASSLQLFAARGYDAVGVQEIVESVGITKPTLYHYFGSKQGLLETLLEQYFTQLNEQLRQAALYTGDLPQTLTRIVQTYFRFAHENPTFYRFQLGLWFSPVESDAHQAMARWSQEQYEVIEQVFTLASSDHGNMRNRQRAYAVSLMGVINTYIGLALNGFARLDDELAYQALRQFQYGIYS